VPGSRKVEPKFTIAQAGEIRAALKDVIQFRANNRIDDRAVVNALNELDRAQREAQR
jgi:hypothetical protein